MFAYCLNNPASRVDSGGDFSYKCLTDKDDTLVLPWENAGGGGGDGGGASGGGSNWSVFMRTLQGALDGLSMAAGQRDITHTEQHHLLSDKSKIYTPQYKEVTDRYNYTLDHSSNINCHPVSADWMAFAFLSF